MRRWCCPRRAPPRGGRGAAAAPRVMMNMEMRALRRGGFVAGVFAGVALTCGAEPLTEPGYAAGVQRVISESPMSVSMEDGRAVAVAAAAGAARNWAGGCTAPGIFLGLYTGGIAGFVARRVTIRTYHFMYPPPPTPDAAEPSPAQP
eukprot:TRINITY_DN56869_c0_g1_i1.p1 TRINITY_DN56869_c0_g1~~TRINITY_DN56869_c0_g1_i1.p1  ORF type:complete len:147 (+),score=19.70 TRINITY_DN56869_c0_g1_i1:86-526(+)